MDLIKTNNTEVNRYELTIQVSPEEFEQSLMRVYQKNVKNISVQGFRKGKAPRNIVEKIHGESVFFEDAINDLYPTVVKQGVKQAGLEIVSSPTVEVTQISKEEGVTLIAKCVTKPDITVQNYKEIAVEKEIEAASDEDVNKKLQEMQEKHARMIDASDRPAREGDTVRFDFDGYLDGERFEGGQAKDYSLVLGSNQFIPGFEKQIEQHSVDEEFEIFVTFPEDYHAPTLQGKDVVFQCVVKEIQEKELPALDDEFAKDASEFDTLDQLKEDLKSKQQQQYEKKANEKVENQLIDAVIEQIEGDIPPEMYEVQIDQMMHDFEYRLQGQGLNIESYLRITGMDMKAMRKTFQQEAERQVKIRLALEKIVELESIQINDEDMETEYKSMAQFYKMPLEQIKGAAPDAEMKKDLAIKWALNLVKDSAKITTKTASI